MSTTMNTSAEYFHQARGVAYDFYKMAAKDWDEFYDGQKLNSREYTSWNALNIIRLSLAIWILASHTAIITFVLAKKTLRNQPKNLLIVNMALAHMLMGGFIVPVKQHFVLHPSGVECSLAVGWTFIMDYYQSSVALFAALNLVFERFVYVYSEKNQKNIRPWAGRIGTVLLIVAPWTVSSLFLLPTFYWGLLAKSADHANCLYKVDDRNFVASHLISVLPASVGVFLLAPFTGLLDCLRPKQCFYQPLTPRGESMTVTAFVSFFSIFSEVPYCVVRLLMLRMECNNPFCSRFNEALTMTIWIRLCKSAIFPFIWLSYTDIRDALMCHLKTEKEYDDAGGEEEKVEFGSDSHTFALTQSPSKVV